MNERSVRYLLNAFMGMNGITDEDMERAGYYTAERVGELQAKEADHLLAAQRERPRKRWDSVQHDDECNIIVLGADPLTIDGDCTCGAVNTPSPAKRIRLTAEKFATMYQKCDPVDGFQCWDREYRGWCDCEAES